MAVVFFTSKEEDITTHPAEGAKTFKMPTPISNTKSRKAHNVTAKQPLRRKSVFR